MPKSVADEIVGNCNADTMMRGIAATWYREAGLVIVSHLTAYRNTVPKAG